MTLRHMKILVEVYRQNSVTKAAQALHLSQPSVSLALRELEDYYGVTLFERVGRRISPTECGREFYGYAVHVVSLMDELETRMRTGTPSAPSASGRRSPSAPIFCRSWCGSIRRNSRRCT